eukprot:8104229-Alexandrium_andersonii.AAC.1
MRRDGPVMRTFRPRWTVDCRFDYWVESAFQLECPSHPALARWLHGGRACHQQFCPTELLASKYG